MKKMFGILAIGLLTMSVSSVALADEVSFKAQVPIPGINVDGPISGNTLGSYVLQIYTFSVYAGGIVATITIMMAGFVWLMAAGNIGQVDKAQAMIKGALTGYGLLLMSWLLLNAINPNLVRFKSLDIMPVDNIELNNESYAVFDGECPAQSDERMKQFPEGYIFKPAESKYCPSLNAGQVCCYLDVSVSGCALYESTPESSTTFKYYLDDRVDNSCGSVPAGFKCYCKRPNEDSKRCWYKLKDDRSQGSFAQCVDSSSIAEGVNPDPDSYTQSIVSDLDKSCTEIVIEDANKNGRRICP